MNIKTIEAYTVTTTLDPPNPFSKVTDVILGERSRSRGFRDSKERAAWRVFAASERLRRNSRRCEIAPRRRTRDRRGSR